VVLLALSVVVRPVVLAPSALRAARIASRVASMSALRLVPTMISQAPGPALG